MSTRELHPQPRWTAVAAEQLEAVWLAIRREAFLAVGLLIGFGGLMLWMDRQEDVTNRIDAIPEMALPMFLLAFLLPLAVWKAEQPERRSYLWSLPVERSTHHLTKLAVGWCWLMAALAIYLIWLFVMAKLTGGNVGAEWQSVFIGPDPENRTSQDYFRYSVETSAWEWLVPITAVTTTYLLGSILAIGSNYPLRWIAGGVFVWFLIGAFLLEVVERDSMLTQLIADIFINGSPYGFFGVIHPEAARLEVIAGAGEQAHMVRRPSVGIWLTATSVWMGLGIVGSCIAAIRHREP